MDKFIKHTTQNLIDFVVTTYGTLEKLFSFFSEVGYKEYADFENDRSKTLSLKAADNAVTDTYENLNHVISTKDTYNKVSNLACNNDLTVNKSIVGSFSDAYNNSFDINRLDAIVVGYEGTDIIVTWSVTNNGNITETVNAVLSVTGYANRTISKEIKQGETYIFKEIYTNLLQGIKTILLTGLCIQEIEIEVLGSINFVCNNDLHIVTILEGIIRAGEDVTIEWSVTNVGTAHGNYTGEWYYDYEGKFISNLGTRQVKENLSVIINAGQTYTFTKIINVSEGLYNVVSSCNDKLIFEVKPSLLLPNIVYNNDLHISQTDVQDGDTISVMWSVTNNGDAKGEISGYLEVYPSDSFTNIEWRSEVEAGVTKIFSEDVTVYACERTLKLTGGITDSLQINVNYIGVAKYVFWADLSKTEATTPVFSQKFLIVYAGQLVGFHVLLINNELTSKDVNVKFTHYSEQNGRRTVPFTFLNTNVKVESSINCTNGNYANAAIGATSKGLNTVTLYLDNVIKGTINYQII